MIKQIQSKKNRDDDSPFARYTGLKIEDKILTRATELQKEIDELYVSLISDQDKILINRRAEKPITGVKEYSEKFAKLLKSQKELQEISDLIKKNIETIYKVVPSQDLANSLVNKNSKNGSTLLALAGFLPNQEGIATAITAGNLSMLKWLASAPRFVFPDQSNVNLARELNQWEIFNWLVSSPYYRRSTPRYDLSNLQLLGTTRDKTIAIGNIPVLVDVESRYKIESKLGQGSFGSVFKAIDLEDPKKRQVALKFLDPKNINKNDVEREVGLLAELSADNCQKNIVCYYGLMDATYLGKPVIVISMEFIDGTDLWKTFEPGASVTFNGKTTILKTSALEPELARHITEGLLNGLKFLHDKHIYHLDIKEGNIMVQKSNLIPIYVDFGLGCQANVPKDSFKSCDTAKGGSPYYISRQRLTCLKNINAICTEDDNRSTDIWALGIVLLHVLNRKELPDDPNNIIKYREDDEWVSMNANNLYPLDKQINDLIRRALSSDPRVTVDELISIFNNTGTTHQNMRPNVRDFYKKDINKCGKNPSQGGYSMTEIINIAKNFGIPTVGRLKKDICKDLKNLF